MLPLCRQEIDASILKQRSYRERSFFEFRRPNFEAAEFGNLEIEVDTSFSHKLCHFRSQPTIGDQFFCMHGGTQNVTNFFFHTAAVALSAPLQTGFHVVFDVADYKLSQCVSPICSDDITISFPGSTSSVSPAQLPDNPAHELLGIAKQHQRAVEIIERVIDPGEAGAHAAFDDHDG